MDAATQKTTLGSAASLLASDPKGAEREARRVLEAAPSDPNATLILGAALRRQGRASDAIAVLEPLVRTFPRAHPSRFELGMALADAGQPDAAIEMLRAATELNRFNHEAWSALGALLFDRGDARGADAAFTNHHLALIRDPRLAAATEALYGARVAEAETMLRSLVEAGSDDILTMMLYADALSRRGKHADAAGVLRGIVEKTPDNHLVRFRLARELYQVQDLAEATEHIDRLIDAEPKNPSYRNLLAGVLSQAGDQDGAIGLYEGLLATHPDYAANWINYAHALRIAGRAGDASSAYRRAIALDPALPEAYLGLANLKNGSLGEGDLPAIRDLAGRSNLSALDRERVNLALGQALEDQGDYARAFAAYAEGAAARRAIRPYDAGGLAQRVDRICALMDGAFFAARKGFGAGAPDPIFVVGLPRSGSSLIEQILASHSAVEGVGELADLAKLAARLGALPDGAASLGREDAAALGESYLAASRAYRRLGRPFFVDKMPNNFEYVGLIQLILPNAKIVDVRRHPMASCFSAFKQHFAQAQDFSYDLVDLGRYYRDYLRLMRCYDDALPSRVHRVIYEDLVEDAEPQIRRLLDYCGLPFESACLAFHQTRRPVRTPSSEQVRRPIFREGLEHWRHFEPWLGPLQMALGPALEDWRG